MGSETEKDYVLGTGDSEIRRLGIQHEAWRDAVKATWARAGIGPGHTVVDVGCGPGYAALDLAKLVGPSGRVVAIDRSKRFLDHLSAQAQARGLRNIECLERDLDTDKLPEGFANFVWARWIFIFVKNPRALMSRVHRMLRPRGTLILHEYAAYSTWKSEPPSAELTAFVQAVMDSWRAQGGDANIADKLVGWLREEGAVNLSTRPMPRVERPGDLGWAWLRSYLETGPARLVELGHLDAEAPARIQKFVEDLEAQPNAKMWAPLVTEIIAGRGFGPPTGQFPKAVWPPPPR